MKKTSPFNAPETILTGRSQADVNDLTSCYREFDDLWSRPATAAGTRRMEELIQIIQLLESPARQP